MEAAEGAMGLDETVLRGLLRVRRASGEQVGGAKRDPLVHAHELLVGTLVAAPSALDELILSKWSAHHRREYTGR